MGVNSVLVCGGGIGGLTLAVALGQRGVKVEVVEIKPTTAVQGIGISVPANALRVLDGVGVVQEVIAAGLAGRAMTGRHLGRINDRSGISDQGMMHQ